MRHSTSFVLGAVFTASVTAQGGIPSAMGHSSAVAPTTSAIQPLATNEIPPIAGLTTTSAAGGGGGITTTTTSSAGGVTTSTTSAMTSSTTSSPVNSATINYNSIPFGSTLANGGYVCNPAHFYASTLSCDDSNVTPTLVTVAATGAPATVLASSTAVNGSVIAYTGYTPTGTAWIGTWTGAADVNVVPLAGALIAGAVAFVV